MYPSHQVYFCDSAIGISFHLLLYLPEAHGPSARLRRGTAIGTEATVVAAYIGRLYMEIAIVVNIVSGDPPLDAHGRRRQVVQRGLFHKSEGIVGR